MSHQEEVLVEVLLILEEVHLAAEEEAPEVDTVFNKCCVLITLNYQNDGRVIWI